MIWPNIHTAEFAYDPDVVPGYDTGEALIGGKAFGDAAGGQQMAVRLFEIPPGNSLCPYHYEYSEEWLLVMSGELDLRTPGRTEPIKSGDLVCFPSGPDGAHKVTTTGAEPARVLMWSRRAVPEVAVYPDSDKIGVFTDNERDRFRFFRKDADVAYFDGEVS